MPPQLSHLAAAAARRRRRLCSAARSRSGGGSCPRARTARVLGERRDVALLRIDDALERFDGRILPPLRLLLRGGARGA